MPIRNSASMRLAVSAFTSTRRRSSHPCPCPCPGLAMTNRCEDLADTDGSKLMSTTLAKASCLEPHSMAYGCSAYMHVTGHPCRPLRGTDLVPSFGPNQSCTSSSLVDYPHASERVSTGKSMFRSQVRSNVLTDWQQCLYSIMRLASLTLETFPHTQA